MKPQFYLIVVVIIIIIIAVLFAASNASPNAKKAGQVAITVQAEIGVESIRVVNKNVPNGGITLADVDLPFKFNCDKDATLQFYVTTIEGYRFNTWWMDSTKTFNEGNPLTIKVSNDLTMTAKTSLFQLEIE